MYLSCLPLQNISGDSASRTPLHDTLAGRASCNLLVFHHSYLPHVKNSSDLEGTGIVLARVKGEMLALKQVTNILCQRILHCVSTLAASFLPGKSVLSSTNSEGNCWSLSLPARTFNWSWHGNFLKVAKLCAKYCIGCTRSWKAWARNVWGQGQLFLYKSLMIMEASNL